jgi:ketosteroid isomerase-like protein
MRYLILLALLLFALTQPTWAQSGEEAAVAAVLDDFHDAASKADGARYFGHFAEDAVFLGTDITERWTVDAFKAYALPYFDQGRGWTYVPQARHVYVSSDGQSAWFDEILRNENFGDTRGTGVLLKVGDAWKVAQYHLTLPVPNDLIYKLVEMIEAGKE